MWFCYFFLYAASPLNVFLSKPALYGLLMLPRYLFFLVCLWDLFKTVSRRYFEKDAKGIVLLCFFVIALSISYNDVYTEAFYWHSASHYMIWQALCLLTVSLEIRYFDNLRCHHGNTTACALLLSVTGFVACTFFYTAVLPGMVYLFLWQEYRTRANSTGFPQLLPLAAMIAGGLSSALAPGNYARRATTADTPLQPFRSLVQASKLTLNVFLRNMGHPLFILTVVFLFLIGMCFMKPRMLRPRMFALLVIGDAVMLILICVPYVLPQAQPELVTLLPDRYLFLMDTNMILSIYGIALCAGSLLHARREATVRFFKTHLIPVLCAAVALVLALLLKGGFYKNFPPLRIMYDATRMVEYHKTWCGILEEICLSGEPDVTFHVDEMLQYGPVVRPPEITPDATDWKNEAVAKTFQKHSVAVFYDQ